LKQQAGVIVDTDTAKAYIDTYRSTNNMIPQLWKQGEAALRALAYGQEMVLDKQGLLKVVPGKGIQLPNGLFIQYPDLRRVVDEESGKASWIYTSKGLPVHIYGGKCLAADTEVLTPRGWISVIDVTLEDQVWDGVEWVNHDGLTYQGEKPTIVLNGVSMTSDHQVLTEEGWRDASSCEGLHRAEFWMPDGSHVCGYQRTQVDVGVSVRVRGDSQPRSHRRGEVRQTWGQPLMRVRDGDQEQNSWYGKASSILGMALDARPMSAAFTSSMAQLRGAWDSGMYYVGQFVRRFLGGYGRYVPVWAYVGSQGQQRELREKQLSVGFDAGSSGQSPGGTTCGYSQSQTTDGYFHIDTPVSLASKAVYDIRNAGHRSRFVVRGSTGPFIVHNCIENVCQAVARIVIGEQMLRIQKRYQCVLTVHDAAAVVAKEDNADSARAYVEECMNWRPKWAQTLPLACESGMGKSYGDC
jgi:hypothetical protein